MWALLAHGALASEEECVMHPDVGVTPLLLSLQDGAWRATDTVPVRLAYSLDGIVLVAHRCVRFV